MGVEVRATLPDSLALLTGEGAVLFKTDAVIRCLRRLGGLWRPLGWCLWCIPRPIRDALYDLVAALRHRLFAQPKSACPLLPDPLRDRFLELPDSLG